MHPLESFYVWDVFPLSTHFLSPLLGLPSEITDLICISLICIYLYTNPLEKWTFPPLCRQVYWILINFKLLGPFPWSWFLVFNLYLPVFATFFDQSFCLGSWRRILRPFGDAPDRMTLGTWERWVCPLHYLCPCCKFTHLTWEVKTAPRWVSQVKNVENTHILLQTLTKWTLQLRQAIQ